MDQWYPVTGHKATGTKSERKNSIKTYENLLFYTECGHTLDQVDQRCCEDTQNPTGHGLEQPALANPALR